MIKFNELQKRKLNVMFNDEIICELNLAFNSVTNKFDEITKFIEECSTLLGIEFDNWFKSYLTEYKDSNYNHQIILNHIPNIKKYVELYLTAINVNYAEFSDEKKRSKTSIYFSTDEIKKLTKVSCYLKIFAIISHDKTMKMLPNFYKEVYNILIKDIATDAILYKIFNLVNSKINKYKVTDSYMWEYIKMRYCKTVDIHTIHIFNWIIHNILIICDAKQNPISFISSVINNSIKWILHNVYKDSIIYSEAITTEDANMVPGKDKLETFAYNDTIAKLLVVAYNSLEQEKISEEEFKIATNDKKQMPTSAKYITFPILCKALKIPYKHLITIPSEHAYLLNILLHNSLSDSFKVEYPVLTNLLMKYNTNKEIKKTTYTIFEMETFENTFKEFLTTKDSLFAYDFYSSIVGKMLRNTYGHFKNGSVIDQLPKLEKDIVLFYNKYFSDGLNVEIESIGKKLNEQL
jgi:hypothetical protein